MRLRSVWSCSPERWWLKNGLMIAGGFVAIMMICTMPAGAHTAVNDAFTVIDTPFDYRINLLNNDIPHPDPSVTDIVYTEQPKHGTVGPWGYLPHGDVGYFPEMFYFGPDSFKYRTYDGHSYSNEATVSITVVPYGGLDKCPTRVWLSTPPDTTLSLENRGYAGCSGEDLYLRLESDPGHGRLIHKMCAPVLWHDWYDDQCYDYIPDPGFRGWDSFTVRPYIDTGDYGDCPGYPIDVSIHVGSEPNPSPEFPSVLLPVIMMAVFIGTVLVIRRSREQ